MVAIEEMVSLKGHVQEEYVRFGELALRQGFLWRYVQVRVTTPFWK